MDCLKTDDFELFRAIVDPLDPLDREEVLAVAPAPEDGRFRVPPILGLED